jgi:rubrerythrin
MKDKIAGVVSLEDYLIGLRADVLGEHDPAGLTVERLLHAVERHIALESDALDQYEQLATSSGDAVIALVMRLILDDEQRHHGLLMRIATTLRDGLNWTRSPEALPMTTSDEDVAHAADLATTARALIEEERSGAQAMRRLAAQERGLDSGLDSLLLEMMAMDSEKHAHLLRFVEKRLEARARGAKR